MILCIGTTPAAQRVMVFRQFQLEAVNRAERTFETAAGKSINVAKVLKALGEEPLALSVLGGNRGKFIRDLLAARGIGLQFVPCSNPTRQCTTLIDESSGEVTELVEESRPLAEEECADLLKQIRPAINRCAAAVMSGTLAPGVPPDLYRQCTAWARESGTLAVVDAQGIALLEALPAQPGLVKPNRAELAATVGHALEGEPAVCQAMRTLSDRGAQRVLVTAGKEPALAFEGGRFWRAHTPKIRPVNPIGSGDAFTAGVVWALVRGDDLGEACKWGAAAGAANALGFLPGELDRGDVERLAKEVLVEKLSL